MVLKVAVGTRTQDYLRVVVMPNVMDLPQGVHVTSSYDLKGSTSNRYVSPEKQNKTIQHCNSLPTLKDLNFRNSLQLPNKDRMALLQQLDIDTTFLTINNIMDYSLLIGYVDPLPISIPNMPEASEAHFQRLSVGRPSTSSFSVLNDDMLMNGSIGKRNVFQRYHGGLRAQIESTTQNGYTNLLNRIYYIALIDTLQMYDASKVAERVLKVNVLKPLASLFGFAEAATSPIKKDTSTATTTTATATATMPSLLIRPSKPKKLKSRGTEKYVGPVIGGYQTECPFCKGIVYVSDQKVDGMFQTGIFGPIDCGGTFKYIIIFLFFFVFFFFLLFSSFLNFFFNI